MHSTGRRIVTDIFIDILFRNCSWAALAPSASFVELIGVSLPVDGSIRNEPILDVERSETNKNFPAGSTDEEHGGSVDLYRFDVGERAVGVVHPIHADRLLRRLRDVQERVGPGGRSRASPGKGSRAKRPARVRMSWQGFEGFGVHDSGANQHSRSRSGERIAAGKVKEGGLSPPRHRGTESAGTPRPGRKRETEGRGINHRLTQMTMRKSIRSDLSRKIAFHSRYTVLLHHAELSHPPSLTLRAR